MAKDIYKYKSLTTNVDPNKAVDWMLWVVLEYNTKPEFQEAVKEFVDKNGEDLYDLFNTEVYDYVKDFLQSNEFIATLKDFLEDDEKLAELSYYLSD